MRWLVAGVAAVAIGVVLLAWSWRDAPVELAPVQVEPEPPASEPVVAVQGSVARPAVLEVHDAGVPVVVPPTRVDLRIHVVRTRPPVVGERLNLVSLEQRVGTSALIDLMGDAHVELELGAWQASLDGPAVRFEVREGQHEVTLLLPDERLYTGQVFDAEGSPVPEALVDVFTDSQARTLAADGSGRFSVVAWEAPLALRARKGQAASVVVQAQPDRPARLELQQLFVLHLENMRDTMKVMARHGAGVSSNCEHRNEVLVAAGPVSLLGTFETFDMPYVAVAELSVEREMSVALKWKRRVPLRGVVRTRDGKPLPGVSVRMVGSSFAALSSRFRDPLSTCVFSTEAPGLERTWDEVDPRFDGGARRSSGLHAISEVPVTGSDGSFEVHTWGPDVLLFALLPPWKTQHLTYASVTTPLVELTAIPFDEPDAGWSPDVFEWMAPPVAK